MLNGDASTPRRRRASSQLTTSPYIEGGHVPFTHHVPVVTVDEDEGSETASIPVIQDQPVTVENGGLQREVSIKLDLGKKEEKKGRISQLFHRKSKKGEVRPAQPPSEHHHSDHKAHEEAKEREKQESVRQKERLDREGEMKRKEAERREAEVVQGEHTSLAELISERRFRALTQVAGHPESERMAYRTASHLRAYYNHIYDGLDNPPRMNPLAVLRWRIRTNEQIEAKSKWEALQTETKVAPDFGDIMHASPVSIGTPHFGRPAKSEANRPSSLGSNRMPSPRRNKSEFDFASTAKRWRYTMEDVAAYKECDGVVNYFIPPRPPSATEVVGCERMESRPENSSIADSMKKVDTQAQANVTAASQNGNDRSTESPDASLAPLSRSVSFETGGQSDRFRDHRVCRAKEYR